MTGAVSSLVDLHFTGCPNLCIRVGDHVQDVRKHTALRVGGAAKLDASPVDFNLGFPGCMMFGNAECRELHICSTEKYFDQQGALNPKVKAVSMPHRCLAAAASCSQALRMQRQPPKRSTHLQVTVPETSLGLMSFHWCMTIAHCSSAAIVRSF